MALTEHQQANTTATVIERAQPWLTLIALVILPAAASCISQLTLAPAFGAIPSAVNHATALVLTFTLGLLLQRGFPNTDVKRSALLLGVWIFYIPVIQSYIIPYHAALGIVGGPILHGLLSCHSIIVPSAIILARCIDTLPVRRHLGGLGRRTWLILGGAVALVSFQPIERWMMTSLPRLLTYLPAQTPVHLQVLLATAYIALNGNRNRRLVLLAIPAIIHTATLNPHYSAASVNRILANHNWALLERRWSETGYIAVLESRDKGYRIMRADHSLLGGEWTLTPERVQNQGWKTPEPIYAVFQLLEAVRLMEIEPPTPDVQASALVIGLGIGTAPKALISHGINTTVLELDPVVHRFATDYFSLPRNHTFIHTDAIPWLSSPPASPSQTFTYIIHDVFTGGAEPLPLFTLPFLTNLRARLAPHGVIALNYAGELDIPLTTLVLRTISRVFGGNCRAYRDSPPPPGSKVRGRASDPAAVMDDGVGDEASRFANIVVFCRNSPGPITFRQPTKADFLASLSRRTYLFPPAEQEVELPGGEDGDVLGDGDVKGWEKQQVESAKRHWKIMRGVVGPAVVWDAW